MWFKNASPSCLNVESGHIIILPCSNSFKKSLSAFLASFSVVKPLLRFCFLLGFPFASYSLDGISTQNSQENFLPLRDVRIHDDYKAIKDLFDRKHDNFEICLLERGHEDEIAYIKPGINKIFVNKDVTPEIIVHEYTHLLDFLYNGDSKIYKMQLLLYNTKGKGIDELKKDFFEGIAIENEEIANRRLKGDKNVKFRRPTSTFTTILQKIARGKIGFDSLISAYGVFKRRGKTTTKRTRKIEQDVVGYHNSVQKINLPHKEIEKATRDSLYKWYGEVEKARFDVDKDLNHLEYL